MPTYIFKCESCGEHKAFPFYEGKMAEPDKETPIQRHCLPCGTMTNWMLAFPDRRSGDERRERARTVGQQIE